jgi:hypothetical protein
VIRRTTRVPVWTRSDQGLPYMMKMPRKQWHWKDYVPTDARSYPPVSRQRDRRR